MKVLELTTDDPIADYATLKIRSGVDNKFFDYNIKNLDDQLMLIDLLDKTSKSFFDLEKAFVSYLETGESKFMIAKNRVEWISNTDVSVKGKPSNYKIKCKVDFTVGDSYLGFYRLANNEITALNNYIKSSNLYAQGISTKFAKGTIADSIKHLENAVIVMEEALEKSDEKLDQVYNDFKAQLVDVFMEAVSIRSNGLIDPNTLRDRINANLTNVSTGEVKDGFYEKLDQSRRNFINMNRDIIDDLLNTNIKNAYNDKEPLKVESEMPTLEEFFNKSSDRRHQNLRNTIIVNEVNKSKEEDPKEMDPKEFFSIKNSPVKAVAENIDHVNLGPEEVDQEIDPKEFLNTNPLFKDIIEKSGDLDEDFSAEKED